MLLNEKEKDSIIRFFFSEKLESGLFISLFHFSMMIMSTKQIYGNVRFQTLIPKAAHFCGVSDILQDEGQWEERLWRGHSLLPLYIQLQMNISNTYFMIKYDIFDYDTMIMILIYLNNGREYWKKGGRTTEQRLNSCK